MITRPVGLPIAIVAVVLLGACDQSSDSIDESSKYVAGERPAANAQTYAGVGDGTADPSTRAAHDSTDRGSTDDAMSQQSPRAAYLTSRQTCNTIAGERERSTCLDAAARAYRLATDSDPTAALPPEQ
jgi:hypothetical protein